MIVSMQNALIRLLASEPDLSVLEDVAGSGLPEFLGLLCLCFLVVLLILIGVLVYRIRKIRRLTAPANDRIYRH